MRRPNLTFRATAVVLAPLIVACTETTMPTSDTPIDIALDFCATDTPVWFAFQNAGEPWVRVTPDAEGTFHFGAKRRVAIAYVFATGASYQTDFIGMSNVELSAVSGTACLDENGTKNLSGTVSGATGSQLSRVSMSFSTALIPASQATFTLTQLAERPLDLIASRVTVSGTTLSADRIIVRRNQNFVNNASVPVLDFVGVEAFSPGTSTVNVTGASGTEVTELFDNFSSQQKTSHLLYYAQIPGDGQVPIPVVPTAQTAAGDYHDIFVIATATDGSSFRGAESYFRNPPATQILPLGPVLTTDPVFNAVSTTPYVQLRMVQALASNAAYNRAATFTLEQQTPTASREVNVTVTEGFYNFNPTAWDVTIPDLSDVAGWQNVWGLEAGTEIDWAVTTYFGRPTLLFGVQPAEGEGIQFAGLRSTTNIQAALTAGASAGITAPLRRSVWRHR